MNLDFSKILIAEHSDYMVVNKPAGIVVNRSQTAKDKTLQDYLLEYQGLTPNDDPNSYESRGGIVHRLDKDTSGVLVVAKNAEAFEHLQRQFKERRVEKEYRLVTHGKMQDGPFEIQASIARYKKNRTKFVLDASGKASTTRVEKIDTKLVGDQWISSAVAWPKTGRTHQIRVHLTAMNYPIVKDRIYSGPKQYKWAEEVGEFDRMMLHAHKITILDPSLGEKAFELHEEKSNSENAKKTAGEVDSAAETSTITHTFEAPLPPKFDLE